MKSGSGVKIVQLCVWVCSGISFFFMVSSKLSLVWSSLGLSLSSMQPYTYIQPKICAFFHFIFIFIVIIATLPPGDPVALIYSLT